jgi:hypothetical protein
VTGRLWVGGRSCAVLGAASVGRVRQTRDCGYEVPAKPKTQDALRIRNLMRLSGGCNRRKESPDDQPEHVNRQWTSRKRTNRRLKKIEHAPVDERGECPSVDCAAACLGFVVCTVDGGSCTCDRIGGESSFCVSASSVMTTQKENLPKS